jgi:hypothetical protein
MQAALEEALDGDIISISPGYYAEQLMIERDNVRIVGKVRGGGEVVMECTPEKRGFQANRDAGNCPHSREPRRSIKRSRIAGVKRSFWGEGGHCRAES